MKSRVFVAIFTLSAAAAIVVLVRNADSTNETSSNNPTLTATNISSTSKLRSWLSADIEGRSTPSQSKTPKVYTPLLSFERSSYLPFPNPTNKPTLVWTKAFEAKPFSRLHGFSRPYGLLLAGDFVLCATSNLLMALRTADGSEVWRHIIESKERAMPFGRVTVVDGIAYFGTDRGRIEALAITSGKLLFEVRLPDERKVEASPVVVSNNLYCVQNRMLCCVNLASKAVEWRAPVGARGREIAFYRGTFYYSTGNRLA